MNSTVEAVPVERIAVGDRCRKGAANVLGLAESIQRIGLLHPIVLNGRYELVAGARRLAAAVKLGWKEVPCRVVATLDDAVAALQAERDENTCREAMAFEELVEIGKRLEAMEKPKAKERKGARTDTPGGKLPPGDAGKTRDKVGVALGISGKTYEKAKAVVEAAEAEPEKFGDLPAIAKEQSVSAAHEELKRRVRPEPPSVRASDRTQAVADALAALAAWQRRYEHLTELNYLFEAISAALPSIPAN